MGYDLQVEMVKIPEWSTREKLTILTIFSGYLFGSGKVSRIKVFRFLLKPRASEVFLKLKVVLRVAEKGFGRSKQR